MRHFLILLVTLALLAPVSAVAKPPTRKEIDQTLLGLSSKDLTPISEAEDTLHGFEQHRKVVESELANAKLDQTASKAWVDASKAVGVALEASEKAAEAAARTEELEELAARRARSKQTLDWREARWQAARESVALQQARLALTKSEINRAQARIDLARLEVYNASIGGDADVEVEIGKAQTKIGRLGTQVGKDRKQAEKTERTYDDAVAEAARLDPSM